MKVNVVGGGIAGLCTAWALVRRGREVRLFEQGPLPNPQGSSVDQHRMTRYFYGNLPEYGPMVDEAMRAFDLLWGDLGRSYYVETGVLGLSLQNGDWTDLSREQLTKEGRELEILTPAQLAEHYPFLDAGSYRYGVLMRRGGMLLAERIVAHLAGWLGPAARPHTTVRTIEPETAAVVLEDGTRLPAARLVVAAGPWIGRLVPELASAVRSLRQVLLYLEPPDRLRAAWERAPCCVDFGGGDDRYAMPPAAGTQLKIGFGQYARPGEPDVGREVAANEPAAIFERFRRQLTDPDAYRVLDARSCCYTFTADRRFLIRALGERALAVSCCSGHGFKFGAAVGLRVAEAVVGELAPEALGRWAAGMSGQKSRDS